MKGARPGRTPLVIGAGFFLLFCAVVLLRFAGRRAAVLPPTGSGAVQRPVVPTAMWVWDARIVSDSASRSQLVQFCRSHRIGLLYVSAYDLRAPMDDYFRQFNRQAHDAGIQVHALAGDPRWGKPQYHHVSMDWMESVLRMNAASAPQERFDGIHTDVEVYLLSKTWKEHPEVLLGGYLDLNAEMVARLRQEPEPLHLGVDIPFWFDDDPSYRISWNGQIKLPAQHVIDTVDSVTVMAYRNFAEGSDGTVHLVSLEMAYADPLGKKVIIGQETQENLYPPYVTFGGTSCRALHQELDKIERVLGRRPSFGGFAIHHYDSYRKLCKE